MQRSRRLLCSSARQILACVDCGRFLFFVLAALLPCGHALAQPSATALAPALLDNMDGASTKLQLLDSRSNFRVAQRSIDRASYRFGSGAERIQLRAPAGESAQVAYAIGKAPIIRELRLSADLSSNRTGVRLAARIVLPRSINASTGQPFALLVRGSMISAGRSWQQLTLDNLPQHLASHARVARAKHRQALDERGAYVSHLIFLTPGGAGITELLVDRIRAFGVVTTNHSAPLAAGIPKFTAPRSSAPGLQRPGLASASTSPHNAKKQGVRVPRIIQWQGEPFENLRQLGFNTLAMDRMPTEQELQQAERLGLALFCPPPPPDLLSAKAITAKHNSILAWNLGELLSSGDLEQVENWERLITRYDPIGARPTVLAPQLNALESSRISDVILIGRPFLGTELTIREYAAWLTQRQQLARPGTPTWTVVETQPSSRYRLQLAALSTAEAQHTQASYAQQIASLSAALGTKTSGFYFESQSPLDAEDSATKRRAMTLELTNLRVQLAEPWLATGRQVSSARASHSDLSALVLQTERSHLLVPVWWSQSMQSEVHPREPGPVSFVVPGVGESSEAFLVTLGGVERVRHRRVTGGIRISLEQLPLDAFLLLSDDRQAIAQVTQYVRRIAPRATKIRRELVGLRLQQAVDITLHLDHLADDMNQTRSLLRQVQTELGACDRATQSNSFALAYLHADSADAIVDQALESLLAKAPASPATGNATISHVSIPLADQLKLQRTLARAPLTTNLLRGGGFEDLAQLLDSGWRHKQLTVDGITSTVRLSPDAPHSGSYCLELEARPIDPTAPVTIVPTAPVWITSHPVQVRQGDLLEVTGVARLPEPLVGSVDGLQIIDSFGGTEMALRIQDAPAWQPFKVIRAATSDAQVSVTIALSGLGRAQVDDVAVRVVRK